MPIQAFQEHPQCRQERQDASTPMQIFLARSKSTARTTPLAINRKLSASFQHRTPPPPPPTEAKQLKSQSIPISGAHRTASEVQLCEDEALADYRDYVVFSRIVNHHRQRQQQYSKNLQLQEHQQQSHHPYWQQESDKCLAHVLKTRHSPIHQDTLQRLSHHIAPMQQKTIQDAPSLLSSSPDDYYCGEDAPTTTAAGNWILSSRADLILEDTPLTSDYNHDREGKEDEDEGIFALEL